MKKPRGSNINIIDAETSDYSAMAASVIRRGGVVAIPTETYYGLAVDPFNETALKRLFHIKQRTLDKPVLVLIDNLPQLKELVAAIPGKYNLLFEQFWPGPLTLIFPALPGLSSLLTGGTETIGVRRSSCQIASCICRAVNGPITATSANISGLEPAGSAREVAAIFGSDIDLIVDGGVSKTQCCSTVVGDAAGVLTLIRAGEIDFSSLFNN